MLVQLHPRLKKGATSPHVGNRKSALLHVESAIHPIIVSHSVIGHFPHPYIS